MNKKKVRIKSRSRVFLFFYQGSIDRQEHLQAGKYFRCGCNMCVDPLEQGSFVSCILCPRCKKDYVAIQNTRDKDPYGRKSKWQCRKCKRIFKGCLIKSTIDIGQDLINDIDDGNYKVCDSTCRDSNFYDKDIFKPYYEYNAGDGEFTRQAVRYLSHEPLRYADSEAKSTRCLS